MHPAHGAPCTPRESRDRAQFEETSASGPIREHLPYKARPVLPAGASGWADFAGTLYFTFTLAGCTSRSGCLDVLRSDMSVLVFDRTVPNFELIA